MKVLTSERKGNTYTLEIEESQEEMSVAMNRAYKVLVKNAKIPGFRKGKVPRTIYEKHYGKDGIIKEAVVRVVNDAYSKAITDLDLDVVDSPKNIDIGEYKEEEPIRFKCEVDVKPEVTLGKYKGLKVKKESTDLDESAILAQMVQMRDSYAEYSVTEDSAKEDDIIRYNATATIDGNQYDMWSRENSGLQIGKQYLGEEFDNKMTGLKTGDKEEFSITYADDYANKDVAGKTVDFKIEVVEVRTKILPEITDEFVDKVTDSKTVEELREKIKTNLEDQAKKNSEEKLRSDLMDQILASAKMDIHDVMIEREIDHSLRYFDSNLRRSGSNLEYYLQITGKTMDEMRTDLRESASKRVKSTLILDAICEKENLTVEDPEIEEEIKKWSLPNINSIEDLKKQQLFSLESIRAAISERKAYDFVIENAKIS
jgi:trigger factor